jgi:hypothetical protein
MAEKELMCEAGVGIGKQTVLGLEELVNAHIRGENVEAREKVFVGQCKDVFFSGHCFVKEVALSECIWRVILVESDKDVCGLGLGWNQGVPGGDQDCEKGQ